MIGSNEPSASSWTTNNPLEIIMKKSKNKNNGIVSIEEMSIIGGTPTSVPQNKRKEIANMATLTRRKTGIWEIQFRNQKGQKRTVTLPSKYKEGIVKELQRAIEALLDMENNPTDKESKAVKAARFWVAEVAPDEIRKKLERVGLLRLVKDHTLGELWDMFLKEKELEVKDSTMATYLHVKRRFFEFFGEKEFLSELNPARMKEWRAVLSKSLSPATVTGSIIKTKTLFGWAMENGLLAESPMIGVKRGSFKNPNNVRNISRGDYQRLLDVCPCNDWRMIIALVRIGGLRAPSEVLRLRWSDIDWAKNRFYVTSPKTAHHEGKAGRWVPLFRKLRPLLEKHFSKAENKESGNVVTRYQDPDRTNLGTQFARIAKLAELGPIPRPFDNMRASRSTEIYAKYGAFLESQWIGHSMRTASEFYLQVRDQDFDLAAGAKSIQDVENEIRPSDETGGDRAKPDEGKPDNGNLEAA